MAGRSGCSLSRAPTLSNLALIYLKQTRYDEAEPLYKRSLAIEEKFFGLDNVIVADSPETVSYTHLTLPTN